MRANIISRLDHDRRGSSSRRTRQLPTPSAFKSPDTAAVEKTPRRQPSAAQRQTNSDAS